MVLEADVAQSAGARRSRFFGTLGTGWALLGAVLGLLIPSTLHADCALIPAALRTLPSEDGAVDRPFAAPLDAVTVFSDSSCKPGIANPHFDPDPNNNEVTLIFTPPEPGGVPVSVPGVPTITPNEMLQCGDNRCFALEFEIPDTTGIAGAFPMTGPARIEVRNLAAGGQLVAVVGELFEPAIGCNDKNRFRNLFRHFTVLPPRNTYVAGATTTLQATVDGAGALLIPMDYGNVLATANTSIAALRLLTVSGDFPNGLAGGNGLPGIHGTSIRLPRAGEFLRAFSLGGRPIPPLLEVIASTPISTGGVEYGDTILGSVDFIDSVIRIARTGPNPSDPANTLELFALQDEQTSTGLALQGGVGPIALQNVSLDAGAAAPLNSLTSSDEVTVVARSEPLEAPFGGSNQNSDGDADDLVVEITDLATGDTVSTGHAVTEVARSPRKPVIVTAATKVAYLQSEIRQGFSQLSPDLDVADEILRVWSADGLHPFCSGGACELTSALTPVTVNPAIQLDSPAGRSSLVFSGGGDGSRFVFFPRAEFQEAAFMIRRENVGEFGGELLGASTEPIVSADGSHVAYTSTAIGQDSALVGRPGEDLTFNGLAPGTIIDTTTTLIDGNFQFSQTLLGAGSGSFDDLIVVDTGGGNHGIQDRVTGDFRGTSVVFTRTDGESFTFENITGVDLLGGTDGILAVEGFVGGENGVRVGFEELSTTGTPQVFLAPSLASRAIDTLVVSNINCPECGAQARNVVYTRIGVGPRPKQIFLRDSLGGTNELISLGTGGDVGDGDSDNAVLSGSGQIVAFDSVATDLVAGDTEGFRDIFLKFVGGVPLLRLSLQPGGGVAGDGDSSHPSISDDGQWVAFQSDATNIAGVPDVNGLTDIFLAQPSSGFVFAKISSVVPGADANGPSRFPAVDGDGDAVVFESDASDLLLSGTDTNGATDIYLYDRNTSEIERISVGFGGAEPNGASTRPDITADGRYVVFESNATNLLGPGITLPQPAQCYRYDRLRKVTDLVSTTLGGLVGADAPCLRPAVSSSGGLVVYTSSATNLVPGLPPAVQRTWSFTPLTGAIGGFDFVNGVLSDGPSGTRTSVGESLNGAVVRESQATNLGVTDTNGVSDVYSLFLSSGPSFNTGGPLPDGDFNDIVLHVFDTQSLLVTSTQIPVFQASIAAGLAAVVPFPGAFVPGQIYDATAQTTTATNFNPFFLSLSDTIFCGIAASGEIRIGDPATGIGLSTGIGSGLGSLKAIGDRCVGENAVTGELVIIELVAGSPVVTSTGTKVEDFQVSDQGVAFRTCEADVVPPTDLNGDLDMVDCVMNFWDFDPEPGEPNLIETGHVAVPCTFPGCDPFFEPYRVGPNFVSFVTSEAEEVDDGGSGALGDSCLTTSLPGVCDKTGDRDGDDVAVEIYSLTSRQAQVFPVDEDNPPQIPPFPTVVEGDTSNVMVIQLPAEILGSDFATLPPEQLVTVILGDPEGDGIFEADGNLDPNTAVVDSCPEVANPDQVDADGDRMGAECDTQVDTGVANDDPAAPAPGGEAVIPGQDPTQLCNLGSLDNALDVTISRPEVDQVWADRGTPISAPADLIGDAELEATDLRDKDIDGEVTAVDFRLCLVACLAQPGGCPATEPAPLLPEEQLQEDPVGPPPPGSGPNAGQVACGLLGIEPFLALLPLARRRRFQKLWKVR